MEEQQRDLRQLVMKRAADRTVAGSGVASPAPRGEPLIQQVPKTRPPCNQAGQFDVVLMFQLMNIYKKISWLGTLLPSGIHLLPVLPPLSTPTSCHCQASLCNRAPNPSPPSISCHISPPQMRSRTFPRLRLRDCNFPGSLI